MKRFKTIQVEAERVSSITCNKCARVVEFGDNDYQMVVDFTEIKNSYQYGSTKDGDKYVSHVCEPCMDEIYAGFKIPPQVIGMQAWGEEPPDPIVHDGCQDPEPSDV